MLLWKTNGGGSGREPIRSLEEAEIVFVIIECFN